MSPDALVQDAYNTPGSPARSVSEYSQDGVSQFEIARDSYMGSRQHQRHQSLHVNWTQEDVERMAKEIYDESIADVHLSLLGYWICEKSENYETARSYIRELSLDQGYSVRRIKNDHLRELLNITKSVRPVQAQKKIAILPSSLRKKPESANQEHRLYSPLSSPIREYPPNTPDRPQPLSLKSRYPEKSCNTPTSPRSVSTPTVQSNRMDAIPLPRNSVGRNKIATQLSLLTSTTESTIVPNGRSDDVFGITGSEEYRRGIPFDLSDTATTIGGDNHDPQWDYTEYDRDFSHNSHELAANPSSRTEHDDTYSYCSTPLLPPISEPSILESVSTDQDDQPRTQYTFSSVHTTTAPSPAPFSGSDSGPALPSLAGDFYRSNLFPASNTATIAMTKTTTYTTESVAGKHTKSPSKHTLENQATNNIIAGFPNPAMSNPVCLLPMLVAAAINPPSHKETFYTPGRTTSAYDPSTDPQILTVQIRLALIRARMRGHDLPRVDWTTMSPFERAWREANKELLIWIFGRQDTWLSPGDVSSVKCVSNEMKANEGHWFIDVMREHAKASTKGADVERSFGDSGGIEDRSDRRP